MSIFSRAPKHEHAWKVTGGRATAAGLKVVPEPGGSAA